MTFSSLAPPSPQVFIIVGQGDQAQPALTGCYFLCPLVRSHHERSRQHLNVTVYDRGRVF